MNYGICTKRLSIYSDYWHVFCVLSRSYENAPKIWFDLIPIICYAIQSTESMVDERNVSIEHWRNGSDRKIKVLGERPV